MKISVCLLNYNSYPDTIECLESLLGQTKKEFSIIVVDNLSTNDSIKRISSCLDKLNTDYSTYLHSDSAFSCTKAASSPNANIFLISNSQNKGFSAGNNVAIHFSNKFLKNDQILLLNNDTIVQPDFIDTLSREYIFCKAKEKGKIAMGVTEYDFTSRKQNHCGFHYLHLPSGLAFQTPVIPCFKYICGACLMFDKDAPLMDESYFLYFDDAEYTKILLKKGYTLCTTNKTHYFHKLSSSMTVPNFKIENQFKSMWMFYRKHYPAFVLIVLFIRYFQYVFKRKFYISKIVYRTFKNQTLCLILTSLMVVF